MTYGDYDYPATFAAAHDGMFRWKVIALYGLDTRARTVAGPFWRWATAERIAGAFTQHFRNGVDIGVKKAKEQAHG